MKRFKQERINQIKNAFKKYCELHDYYNTKLYSDEEIDEGIIDKLTPDRDNLELFGHLSTIDHEILSNMALTGYQEFIKFG